MTPPRRSTRRGGKRGGKRVDDAAIPARDAILAAVHEHGRPLGRRQLEERLEVSGGDVARAFRGRIDAMVRDGQLMRTRRDTYGLPDHMDLMPGRVSAHRDGFGFVILDDHEDDLYLSPRQMKRVMNGDRVLATVTAIDRQGRKEGMVVEILERAHEQVVGRFVESMGVARVVPDDPRLVEDVLVPREHVGEAQPGEVVVVEIVSFPADGEPAMGRVVEVLGEAGAPGMATEIAIRNFDLPFEFPQKAIDQAAGYGKEVPQPMTEGRRDYRGDPLVTIDGADARDFDDAVLARKRRNGWQLIVAIADVATYVRPGSALDDEAVDRGTSVYFPGRVIPMLPEALSNGLCSLKPGEDRLCLACEMTIDRDGKVTRSRFVAGVLRSAARLTYGQVQRFIDGDGDAVPADDGVRSNLRDLHELYRALAAARRDRGAIEFESNEVQFRFDRAGEIEEIVPYQRGDAHKIIEECMILANVEAAGFLERSKRPAPYRVHAPPPERKLEPLKEFLRAQGFQVGWKDTPTPADLERIVEQARGRPDESLVMAMLLRSQSLAVYQTDNKGHFGLALAAYTHFTSPIRRYPDLLVHRVIHAELERESRDKGLNEKEMSSLCEQCSHYERRAEEAARDVDERLKCVYHADRIGQQFEGFVSGVTSFGLFVELDATKASGLVHVTALPNDYYHFDPVVHRLQGERSGRTYQLADRVTVKVIAVSIEERQMDFEVVE